MNELVAMKLGEAVALCGMGAELVKEYEGMLSEVMDKAELEKKRKTFDDHTKRSQELGEELGEGEAVKEAADKAREKFTRMRDTFLEGETNNPLKVVSWLGLAAAGGLSIWAILDGASEMMDSDELHDLSEEAIDFQKQNLEDGEDALRALAQKEEK
jgi:hypothetical protein